jgi:biotin carboxyl carrier protein
MKSYKLLINGERYDARILEYSSSHAKININGHDYLVQIEEDHSADVPKLGGQEKAVPMAPHFDSDFDLGSGELRAPLPGVIVSIPVKEGEDVKAGQPIMIIEAMKMESEISSPIDAKVAKIKVKERSLVQEGDILMVLEGEQVKVNTNKARKQNRHQSIPSIRQSAAPASSPVAPAGDKILYAPIPGTIIDVKCSSGQQVQEGDVAIVLEAMKMESDIHFLSSGRVKKIHVNKGDSVQEGAPLIELEA